MTADPMSIGSGGTTPALRRFRTLLDGLTKPRVLELGTLQSQPGRSTHHAEWLPPGSTHIKSDIEAGADVDVVADAHSLHEDLVAGFDQQPFDAAIAVSVWEHLRWPWVCAEQLHDVLKPGGFAYVCTHHAFPVHAYPSDYGRWTTDGLRALFEYADFEVLEASYNYPAKLIPPAEVTVWDPSAPVFLNVDVCLRRPA